MKDKPFLTLSLLLSLVLIVVFSSSHSYAAGTLAGIKICLDPGHGGSDPGAVNSAYGLNESDINLDVSYGLKHLYELEGAEVALTRTGDEYLTNEDRYTFCNEQEATILISVHTNSVSYPDWDGSMALYAPNRDPYLAQAIYEVMYPFLRDTAPESVTDFRDFGLDNFASGVLFKCDMPAAMMEPLLMSHPAEAELLVTPILADPPAGIINDDCLAFSCRRGQIAQAIFLGTLNYFDSQSENEMHVAAIDMSYTQKRSMYFIHTAVTIHDIADLPVPDAEVTVSLTYPDGSQTVDTAVTADDGTAAIKTRSKATGEYQSTIINVAKLGWSYDPSANLKISEVLDIP